MSDWEPDAPVPDPSDAPSYNGLNDQLFAARLADLQEKVTDERERQGVRHERDVLKATQIINDHAPIHPIRYLPEVDCATPACNFHGTFWDHSEHVAKLVLKAVAR